jgi:hypothetical protein
VFLSVDVADPEVTVEGLQAFAIGHRIKWPILMGSNSNVQQNYEYGVPWLFIIDSAGVIRQRHPYPPPEMLTLSNEIDSLIASTDTDNKTDVNNDGVVDILDITLVARAFNSNPGGPNWNPVADIDHNGVIDILDIACVAMDFGTTYRS